ncbi:MAG TPA: M28 family peptidase [Flavobacteriales bacterium]|nr:M28 family peptidase [Flavobacteriales bacterium]
MRTPSILPALVGLLCPVLLQAQLMPDTDALDQMSYDVKYLASDLLEGRESGTAGEKLAVEYIAAKFGNVGLMPYGDSATYLQAFTFQADPVRGLLNNLQLGRRKLKLDENWYPLAFSGTGSARGKVIKLGFGISAPDLKHDDYADITGLKDRIVALSIGSPDGIHPHSKFLAYHDLQARAQKAADLGAAAVVFYNDDPTASAPEPKLSPKIKPIGIPVVFLMGDSYQELMVDGNPCVIGVDIKREERTGYNVVGLLDNGAQNVVVIGAHLDHLGWGDEGSLHRGEKAIHNGADDNASGVAVLLQLARDLAEMDHTRANDYLFIAFSGEEKGLYGSNYWTKNPTVPIAELNYMINLDMVGRLDTAKAIGVNGVGTSPAWAEVSRILVGDLKVKTTTSGIGPSDHTSFYLQGVPAIHFFTGTHADYHKPSDDEEKINYDGMLRITRYIESLIATLNDDGKLAFTKTEEVNTENTPRFKVTLGVVPDYLYDGKGMRIDGVTEGKPAANAGLRKGDVVIAIGDLPVTDMMGYMKALGQFNKGDTAPVKVLREGQEEVVQVTF